MQLVKSVFLDFFRGREVKGMVFDGLMRLMVVVAVDSERVLLRQFKVSPRKQCRGNAVDHCTLHSVWDAVESREWKTSRNVDRDSISF